MKELQDKKYTLQEVKELLREQSFEYENTMSDQKERIFSLVNENESLKKEVGKYKEKETAISEALVSAISRAKEIESQAKNKFEGNLIRLKVFEGKLVSYYKRLLDKYPLDDNLLSAEEFLNKMYEILGTDYMKTETFAKMFKEQNPTLKKGGAVDYAMYEPSDSGFDINEALNPSEDLEAICKELGLI